MKKALTIFTLILLLSVFGFTQNLAVVINALGARESTLTIFKQYAVTDDLTIPANITLEFLQGGSVLISTTKTLTINGRIEAGLYEIFEWVGSGKVVFGSGAVEKIYPQWWGAKGNGATDDSTAIQATIDAIKVTGGTIYFSDATFKIDSGLTLAYTATTESRISFVGGGFRSVLSTADAIDMLTISTTIGNVRKILITRLHFHGNHAATSAIKMTKGAYNEIARNFFTAFDSAVGGTVQLLADCQLNKITDNYFVHISSGGRAIQVTSAYNNIIGHNIIGEDVSYGVYFANAQYNQIIGNEFWDIKENAIQFGTSHDNLISHNLFRNIVKNAILLDTSSYNEIVSNLIHNYGSADTNAFDGIRIHGAGTPANENKISDNRFRVGDQHDISITGGANANDNQVQDNFFSGTAILGLNDQGTNTIRDQGQFGIPSALTIAGGVITVTKPYHLVDGQGDANDDLDTINGFEDGMILILQAEDDAVTITIRDNSVGGGNIETEGDAAIVLDDVEDKAYFIYDATNSIWCEISRFTG